MVSQKIALVFTMVIVLCGFALVQTATSATPTVTASQCFQTCNNYGASENTFSPGEDVYVSGSGFPACSTLAIYVVCHQTTWTNGETIPSRVAGTATTVTTDASGNITLTMVWSHNLVPGSYDIVVDVNCNGKYDQSVDYLDASSVNVNAGFFVIPEYILGAIMGLAGCFAAFGVFRTFKSKNKPKLPPLKS